MRHVLWLLSVMVVVGLVGCSLGTDDSRSLPKPLDSGRVLRVWVAGDPTSIETFTHFQKETGIHVQTEFAPQSEWVNKIVAHKGNPQADLFWSDNATDLAILAGKGAFEPHPSSLAESVPSYARDNQGLWYGLTERYVAVVSSASIAETDIPTTIEQLGNEKWQHVLGLPEEGSGLWYRILSEYLAYEGESELARYLEDLNHLEPTWVSNTTEALKLVLEDSVPLVLTTDEKALSYMAEQGRDGIPIRVQPLGSKHSRQITVLTGIAILQGTEQRQEATQFIDFLLKERNERDLASIRMHHMIEAYGSEGDDPRLHPDEIADLVPLINRYWDLIMTQSE